MERDDDITNTSESCCIHGHNTSCAFCVLDCADSSDKWFTRKSLGDSASESSCTDESEDMWWDGCYQHAVHSVSCLVDCSSELRQAEESRIPTLCRQ